MRPNDAPRRAGLDFRTFPSTPRIPHSHTAFAHPFVITLSPHPNNRSHYHRHVCQRNDKTIPSLPRDLRRRDGRSNHQRTGASTQRLGKMVACGHDAVAGTLLIQVLLHDDYDQSLPHQRRLDLQDLGRIHRRPSGHQVALLHLEKVESTKPSCWVSADAKAVAVSFPGRASLSCSPVLL